MDSALIASFLDCDIVTTNGSDVPRETIEYLKELKKKRDIVVLTDPDMPGKRIRDILNQQIPGLLHAYVPKEKAIKGHKVGVAESDKETILEALAHIVPAENSKREKLSNHLHLGKANAKTMLKRLNALGLTRKEVEEAMKQ